MQASWPSFSRETVKRVILEIYLTYVNGIKAEFQKVKEGMFGYPMFHLNIDLWKADLQQQKYLGIKVFYVNEEFKRCCRTLAIKLFSPCKALLQKMRSGRTQLYDGKCSFVLLHTR